MDGGLDQQSSSFTGTIAGNGVTLQLNQGLGSTTALVGHLQGSGFTLTYPGTSSNLIQIPFVPSSVGAYDDAVAQLQSSTNSTGTAPPPPTGTTAAPTGTETATSPSLAPPSEACVQQYPTLSVVSFHGFCGIKPTIIAVSGDGGNVITKIRWSAWTQVGANGTGVSEIQSCVPDCATGTDRRVLTSVSFSNPHDGLFESMTETRSGKTTRYRFTDQSWPYSAS